jgi:2-polyprenyl-3-methyl-5-hydroxy-6-metoxy-1,4-benzoquinol methylase
LIWTDELVARFWANYTAHPDMYFAQQMGRRLIDVVRPYLRGRKRILDLGCGTGALTGHLLTAGFSVAGADVSGESLETVRGRFEGRPGFLGVRRLEDLDRQPETFDAVFLVEVVEHLSDQHLEATMRRLRSVVAPDGVVIITTPNEEDLARSEVYCPTCDHTFHNMQHLRSWSAATLTEELRRNDFEPIAVTPTDFSVDWRRKLFWYLLMQAIYRLGKRTAPHLLCVARPSRKQKFSRTL